MASIEIIQGSILDFTGDTIVNPANSHLRHTGGLARIIAASARDADWQREQDEHPLIPTGGAGWTSAGCLPYKGIVHAVGPIWGGGSYLEGALLARTYSKSLRVAAEHDCTSIAFPAISCGVFGFPVEKAAPVALENVRATVAALPTIERIVFYLPEDTHYAAFRAELAR